ncbi:MAG: Hsp70 family protein [Oligoflexia bacterium]|nr:Hsp70 family protein [Oligoflexia bacterium]
MKADNENLGVVFGIDLGTTNTCVARYYGKKFEVVEIDHSLTVPSVVAYSDGGEWLVGWPAKNYSKIDPEKSVSSIKRQMGNTSYRKELGGSLLSPIEISAKILEYVKQKTEAKLSLQMRDVVITVPAYFNDYERRSTLEAGKLAGFNVLRIINEPTAAALVYEVGQAQSATSVTSSAIGTQEEKWLVYDLGGGTFDVTVLSARPGQKEVLASCGNKFLGGDDFDRKIVSHIVDDIRIKHQLDVHEDAVVLAKLKHMAEGLKIALSVETEASINEIIEVNGKRLPINLVLSRKQFEEMIYDFIDSTIEKTKEVLREANCSSKEIARLLLVGGSTRIPLVKELLLSHFGLEGQDYVDPDLSVALGACIQGTIVSGLCFEKIVIDVVPHSLGVAALGDLDFSEKEHGFALDDDDDDDDDDDENDERADPIHAMKKRHPKTFSPVIQRNTKLPAKFVNTYYTAMDHQRHVEIAVYQGEAKNTRENLFVGSFMVNISPSPAQTPIDIGMEYDLNGIVKILVAQKDKDSPVLSYRMDLNRPAFANSDAASLRKQERDWARDDEDDDFESDGDSVEGDHNLEKVVKNLLVQRVEDRLTAAKDHPAEQMLARYKELLGSETESDEIDALEDALYDWLDRFEDSELPSHPSLQSNLHAHSPANGENKLQ